MSSNDNSTVQGKRRSRKSIAVMPTNAVATNIPEVNKESTSLTLKPKKKSRSKSLGPGGLDAANAENGLKSGNGNGRRESLAPAAAVKSILKPTLPISPIKPIPAHRTRSGRPSIPPFTMTPTNPIPASKPPKATASSSSSASSSASALNFNPPPATTVPVRTEEEQQRRADILAARAARRQSMGNRRVSFAPEATLHTWDVVEYYPGTSGTPGSSSSGSAASTPANKGPGNLSTIEATPTETSTAADDTPVRLPESLSGQDPVTPMGAAQQKRNFESPVFSSPFSSSPESAFAGLTPAFSDSDLDSHSGSDDDDDDDGEPGAEDRTFMTMGGDETMGEMTMDMVDDDVTGAGFGSFGKRKTWKLEGSTETVEDPAASDDDEGENKPTTVPKEDEGGEMTMEMTRAVGGLLPAVVEYPALPLPKEESNQEDDGGEMTMDMTRAIGSVLPPTFSNPYAEKENEEDAGMDMTMDMTRPVGGILSSAASALQRATRKSLGFFTSAPSAPAAAPATAPAEEAADEDGMTMDMTVAIGGILSKTPGAETEEASSPVGEDMTMDMDMTRPIGGIISAAPKPAARFASSSPASSEAGNEEMTMEFTSVIGGIIGGGGAKSGGRRSSFARGGGAGKLISGAEWAKQQEAQKNGDQENKENKEDDDDDEEGGGDMDFTVAVGGILSKQAEESPASTFPGKDQGVTGTSDDDDGDVDMDGVTMDITTAIGSILPSKTDEQDEWTSASIPVTAEEEAKEVTSSPTPAKRGGRSRRSSVASTTSPRVTRSARKTPDIPPQAEEKSAKESTPENKVETPVQKRQTPPRKAATPKSKTVTPKNQSQKDVETPQIETPIEPTKPAFVFATPQKKTPTPISQPQTPPGQATPAIPPRPKTPSKHTPMIQTPLRQVTSHGFSLSAKKPIGFPISPSPANRITTPRNDAPGSPSTTKGVGINKLGLGSPRVSAKLSSRKSLTEITLPFSPVAIPKDLLKASKADEAADREEEKKEREQELERRRGLDLKSRIELLTPRKASRKSLAYGALLQGQGKRERDEDITSYLGGGKRRKSFEAGSATPARKTFDFDKAPSLPTPGQGRTPRKKAVQIAPEPTFSSSPMAPPPKPVPAEEKMEESSDEEIEEEEEPKITLQQFLSMTSIGFLDGLTTTKRRQTGFPGLELRRAGRRSEAGSEEEVEAPMADCVIAGACTVPMLEMFQHSCRELKQYIKEGREIVKDIEQDTAEENPMLFREYMDAPPDIKVIMDTQFKNVKTHARFLAKGIWYKWRYQLMEGVKSALESNLQDMKADEAALEEAREASESTLPALKARFEAAKKTAERMEEAKRRIESDDKEQLGQAQERLKTVTQRIEEAKLKLAQRSQELAEVNTHIETKAARKAALQEAIDEAERVKEQNRGWSEEEVASWAAKAAALERQYGWSIVSVNGPTVELSFLGQLRVLWDATGAQPPTVAYTAPAIRKPSDPLPLEHTERDFFTSALNGRLAAGAKRTLRPTIAEIDAFWRRCLSTAAEIERVRGWYPVALRRAGGRLHVAISVLVAEVRSKVVVEVVVGADLGVSGGARVVYGGVSGEAVGEFVGRALGVEGAWRSVVDSVVAGCIDGKRKGGVGVPTKA